MKKRTTTLLAASLALGGAILGTNQLFRMATVASEKTVVPDDVYPDSVLFANQERFNRLPRETWTITSFDGLKLKAWYVANQHSEKTVILSHGWRITKARMATYGDLFYSLGFNVLVPDNRAHGESGGKFIGFGYLDRFDYLQWIDMVCQKDKQQKIVLMGMSMGATTVLSVSGEKLPNNVKAVISDSAYTSAYDELRYQAGHMFHLPAFPVLNVLNWMSGWRAGFQYSQADARPLIEKSQLPTLFIHGLADDFVPTKMVYELIKLHHGEHDVWLPKGAGHVAAFEEYPQEYIERVAAFLKQHVL